MKTSEVIVVGGTHMDIRFERIGCGMRDAVSCVEGVMK